MIDISAIVADHTACMQRREVLSVIPDKTNIKLNPDYLVELLDQEEPKAFFGRYAAAVGYTAMGTLNRLNGYHFTTQYDDALIHQLPHADDKAADLAVAVGDKILPIDAYFRKQTNTPPQTPLNPVINILYGKYTEEAMGFNELHFDYAAQRPIVSFKIIFAGKPEHTSVYYPGKWQLPPQLSTAEIARRKAIGIEDDRPKNLFPSNKFRSVSMPYGVVCIEPWNALHSGPTDPRAANTIRGILGVTYDLSQISPLPSAIMTESGN